MDRLAPGGRWPEEAFSCQVSVRYRGQPVEAVIEPVDQDRRALSVTFPDQRPIAAPGQAIVFYRDDEVLGGGTIARIERETVQSRQRAAEPATV